MTSQASKMMRQQSMVFAKCTEITKPLASPSQGALLKKKLSQMDLSNLANTKSFISVLSPKETDQPTFADRLVLEIEDSIDHSSNINFVPRLFELLSGHQTQDQLQILLQSVVNDS